MDDSRLRQLIYAWLDDSILPAELAALGERLRNDEAARQVYLAVLVLHAELHNSASAESYLQEILDRPAMSPPPLRTTSGPLSNRRMWLAIAASLVLAAGLWSAFGGPARRLTAGNAFAALRPLLANASAESSDCHWYIEQADRDSTNALRSGDVVRVTAGELVIRYAHGTEVYLSAPAAFQLIGDKQARMLLGRLTAKVPEAGKGFSVITPRATVIDLGTRFSVDVKDNGATDVVVVRGKVDVDYRPDGASQRRIQRLEMGEAVRLDAAGTASRIVSITSSDRGDSPGERASVIADVRDNIDRMSSLKYYEIVPGGMAEDALAYVDREAHQWNGLDASGMPAYLRGADYVKMFNNDKFNHDIRIGVKLAAPARLYILFDERLEPPAWLRDGFRATGDEIGMDVGPFFSSGEWHNRKPPGVGPGQSVEDRFAIWVKDVPAAGTVYLGSTEAPESEPNMYGILAAPLTTVP